MYGSGFVYEFHETPRGCIFRRLESMFVVSRNTKSTVAAEVVTQEIGSSSDIFVLQNNGAFAPLFTLLGLHMLS